MRRAAKMVWSQIFARNQYGYKGLQIQFARKKLKEVEFRR